MGDVVKYLASEWSFAHFTLPSSHAVATFLPGYPHAIFGTRHRRCRGAMRVSLAHVGQLTSCRCTCPSVVICGDGTYCKYVMDATGACTRDEAFNFLALSDD